MSNCTKPSPAPITVNATNGATVNVNYKIRVVVEYREPDTLRRWADKIAKGQLVAGATIE